jgi:hypothetical protein
MASIRRFLGVQVREMPPTRGHRAAIWHGLFGTVYAVNDNGKVRYFDYDHPAALAYAGVDPNRDPRLYKHKGLCRVVEGYDGPSRNQVVLWITK